MDPKQAKPQIRKGFDVFSDILDDASQVGEKSIGASGNESPPYNLKETPSLDYKAN